MNQSQKSLANLCLFCSEILSLPSMCRYCGFKFCEEHKSTESHQCIKTRYFEYIRRRDPGTPPDVSTGKFRVVCEMCGFSTPKGVPIEYAGEELVQHTQIVGCSDKVYLEQVHGGGDSEPEEVNLNPPSSQQPEPKQVQQNQQSNGNIPKKQSSVVDQIIKLASLKEKGMISEEEFSYIKKELIKKLQ